MLHVHYLKGPILSINIVRYIIYYHEPQGDKQLELDCLFKV